MNLFFFQPEYLSTINLILSPLWFGHLAVLWCGLAGLAALIIAGLIQRLRRRSLGEGIIIIIMVVAWLPLFIQFSYSNLVEAKDTWFMFNRPESEQVAWRNCRIDKFQGLGTGFCFVESFSQDVRPYIPAGAVVTLGHSNVNQYLLYYLYGAPYSFTEDIQRADYYIAYRPSDQLVLLDDGRLFRRPFEEAKLPWSPEAAEYVGRFEVVAEIETNQTIFKRIGS